ncbi:MAG: methionyl-tRNA formyltransferase, partial [Thermodesulfobacteriota bacterium]|nr:methionyl-tRNA formyltransferase [Thermodesulfobacteriota bacterium]
DEGMDTGDILMTGTVLLGPGETSETLHSRLAEVGARLLVETLGQLASGAMLGTPQEESAATYAPFLKKEDGRMDWSKDARSLDALIRGVNPWPGASTVLFGKRLKVFSCKIAQKETGERPGTVLEGFPGELDVATGAGVLRLTEVQLESAKRLPIAKFLRGCPVPPGTLLG